MTLSIYTACSDNEPAHDNGEGQGGLWTNSYIAKGIDPPKNQVTMTTNDGDEQTCMFYELHIIQVGVNN